MVCEFLYNSVCAVEISASNPLRSETSLNSARCRVLLSVLQTNTGMQRTTKIILRTPDAQRTHSGRTPDAHLTTGFFCGSGPNSQACGAPGQITDVLCNAGTPAVSFLILDLWLLLEGRRRAPAAEDCRDVTWPCATWRDSALPQLVVLNNEYLARGFTSDQAKLNLRTNVLEGAVMWLWAPGATRLSLSKGEFSWWIKLSFLQLRQKLSWLINESLNYYLLM